MLKYRCKTLSICQRLNRPYRRPVHAYESISTRSYHMGIPLWALVWNKSVRIYGAFGKNRSHNIIEMETNTLFSLNLGFITNNMEMPHGNMAKRRFQFKKKKVLLWV
jgi:hypothetical protein